MDKHDRPPHRVAVSALAFVMASTASATTGGTLIGMAWSSAYRPTGELIVLSLTALAAILMFWLIWPLRPDTTWSLTDWLLFSAVVAIALWGLTSWGIPWYFGWLNEFALP